VLLLLVGCSFSPGTLPEVRRDADAVDDVGTDMAPPPDAMIDAVSLDAQTDFIIEAESFTTEVDGTAPGQECTWELESSVANYSGQAFMRVVPASGRTCNLANNECAQLIFNVSITVPTTYYVHVRVMGTGSSDNSMHYGVDGTPEASYLTLPMDSTWTWLTGQSFMLATGAHTLHLWQRESGARADVIALTTSASPPP
jgi:hypothetical protein